MPRTSVDVRCMHFSHSLAISCKALHVCRTPSWRRGCILQVVLPLYLRRFTHENQYKHTHESNEKNGNVGVPERTQLKRVQSTKGQGPVSWQTPPHSTYSVRVNCMHYPMYTFSENVQLSAAELDLASLGTQACEERERERERGGGVKRLGPLCLANSSIWEEYLDKFKCLGAECLGFGWVDKAQCFRSARRFGAVSSSPDFSRVFSLHLASRHLNLFRYSSHEKNWAWYCLKASPKCIVLWVFPYKLV